MEEIINSILEIEQQGKDRIAKAIADKNNIIAEAKSTEQEMINSGISNADKQLDEMNAQNKLKAEKTLDEIREKTKNQIDALDSFFDKNKEKWSDEIFNNIVNL